MLGRPWAWRGGGGWVAPITRKASLGRAWLEKGTEELRLEEEEGVWVDSHYQQGLARGGGWVTTSRIWAGEGVLAGVGAGLVGRARKTGGPQQSLAGGQFG